MKQREGFTVIELMIAIIVVGVVSLLLFIQKDSLDSATRDNNRKTSINAMYYSLENAYYEEHKAYPEYINSGVLPTMDPSLFADPNGLKVAEPGSDYRYTPTDCSDQKCNGYTLRANLEREADYIKTSQN